MNDALIQKVQSAQRCVQRARSVYRRHRHDFLDNYDAQDAAVLNLIRTCETSIDIANYLIKRDKLGVPATSGESFGLLAHQGKISSALARNLQAMVGFRNIAVHEYRKLDYAVVIDIIDNRLDDVIAFLDRIVELEA